MSKTITIEVVNVAAPSFVKTAKSGYNMIEVAHKQDGKIGGKRLLDFASPTVYNMFLAAQPGTVYSVEIEKNEKGYWDWVSATPATADTAAVATNVKASDAPATAPVSTGARGRVTGSTYETPEERAVNRAAIIRQSTLNMAIAALGNPTGVAAATIPPTLFQLARQFEDHIYTDLAARAESLEAAVAALKD